MTPLAGRVSVGLGGERQEAMMMLRGWAQRVSVGLVLTQGGCGGGPTAPFVSDADSLRSVAVDTVLSTGRLSVVIPPVYELANIALSRTSFARQSTFLVQRGTPYEQEVAEHFAAFDDDPLIDVIELDPTGWIDGYYGLRDNAYRYVLQSGEVRLAAPYGPLWTPDPISRHHATLTEYSRRSGFEAFFDEHRPHYQGYATDYLRTVDIGGMWAWLETEFDATVGHYTVVLSPLVNGSHSTTSVTHPLGGREILMFIPGTDVVASVTDPVMRRYVLERIVFTEVDHNYVNPASDRHRALIEASVGNWRDWNLNGGGGGYASAYTTFNEHMTWAVFSLYLIESLGPEAAGPPIAHMVRFMEHDRQFPRFGAFNREVIRLRSEQVPGARVVDLVVASLSWMSNQ